ncbi:MAG: GNAT family N-acetyltransferase [Bacteroidales bacterium]
MDHISVKGFGNILIRALSYQEFLAAPMFWAGNEGWNPGKSDSDIFFNTEPGAHLGLEYQNQIIGSGSIMSYDLFGFMGLFIIEKAYRGAGIGRAFWEYRRDALISRLYSKASIGMDGVFNMQHFYHAGGFEFSHRNLRMQGIAKPIAAEVISRPYHETEYDAVSSMDKSCFGFSRPVFLNFWLHDSFVRTRLVKNGGKVKGWISFRPCLNGYKIGPLFADDPETAEALLKDVLSEIEGETYYLDIPEINPHAISLAKKYEMKEVFGCARMYLGTPPDTPWNSIYGITTFELG